MGQSIEIYEVRAHWRDNGKMLEHPIAKATFNKSKKNAGVYDVEVLSAYCPNHGRILTPAALRNPFFAASSPRAQWV